MNREAQKLVEKLNKVYVDRDELNRVCKDRLDFGFDSMIDGQGSDELFAGYANLYPPFFKFLSSEWLLKDGIIEFYNLHNGGIRRRDLLKRILKD